MEIRVFLNGRTEWLEAFRRALDIQSQVLGITATLVTTHDTPLPASSMVLYFGNGSPSLAPGEAQWLKHYLDEGRMVLPVLESVRTASQELPEQLQTINAFSLDRYTPNWAPALVDEVLSNIWLGRTARRMFISYRRSDSAAVAHRLHTHFVGLGFDVFLDEASVRCGVNFQRELKWWMNDADVVLLLVSPRLEGSPWVQEEIGFANTANIGLLGVLWPKSLYPRPEDEPLVTHWLMSDEQYRMEASDLSPSTAALNEQDLSDEAVSKITTLVLTQRARAIRRRLVNLLPFAQDELQRHYEILSQPRLGELLLRERETQVEALVRVMPFRPALHTLHELHQEASCLPSAPQAVGCFYEENDPLDPRVKALHWALEVERPAGMPKRHLLWPFAGRKLP